MDPVKELEAWTRKVEELSRELQEHKEGLETGLEALRSTITTGFQKLEEKTSVMEDLILSLLKERNRLSQHKQ